MIGDDLLLGLFTYITDSNIYHVSQVLKDSWPLPPPFLNMRRATSRSQKTPNTMPQWPLPRSMTIWPATKRGTYSGSSAAPSLSQYFYLLSTWLFSDLRAVNCESYFYFDYLYRELFGDSLFESKVEAIKCISSLLQVKHSIHTNRTFC